MDNAAQPNQNVPNPPQETPNPEPVTTQQNQPQNSQQTQVEPEKDLVVWVTASRPFKRRNREFYVSVISIATVAGLVLFLVDGFLPVMLIISLVFLFYVLSTVEPENIEYKITSYGIKVAGSLTPWNAMYRFWFTRRFESDLLVIQTFSLPGRLELVIPTEKKKEAEEALKKYITHEEAPPTFMDKSANWFAKKMPQG
jgi:hypothetical protein